MADCTDFVPGLCPALAIANCLINRECELQTFGVDNLASGEGIVQADIDALLEFADQLHACNQAIAAAVGQAIIDEGCGAVFPVGFPEEIDTPDLTDTMTSMAALGAEAKTPLGHLDAVFTIDFDSNGKPTRIRT